MSRILVTGSAQGVGSEAARQLIAQGHEVVLHGRDPARAAAALAVNPGAFAVATGAFDSFASTKAFATSAEEHGPYDVIIHNAAAGPDQSERLETVNGLERIFHVNVVSPYILTCLMPLPARLVYVGSDAGQQGTATLDDLQWTEREWNGTQAYADSKLYLAMIALEVAALYPGTRSNVVHPEWIRTSMGGPDAAKPVDEGADSPVWLATSDDEVALGTGQFIYEREVHEVNPAATDPAQRERLIAALREITHLSLPSQP